MSSLGREQQINRFPAAGGSSGSGSYFTDPEINPHSQVWQTPVRHDQRTGTSQASENSLGRVLAPHVHTGFLIYLNLNIRGKICNRPKNDDPSLAESLHAEPSRYENRLARVLSTKHSSGVNYEKPHLILQAGNFNCLLLSGVFFLKCQARGLGRSGFEPLKA